MRGNAGSRRAEEFDALVSGRHAGADAGAQADLLALVAALRAVPQPEARPQFTADLRSQLVAAAERQAAPVDADLALRLTPRQRRGSRERRLAAVVGGFAVVSATGSMAMAAQDALPGEVLYPVKRALENASTNLKSDGTSKASSLLSHAEARLAEVQELTAQDADAAVISSTLQDFTEQSEQASALALDDYTATGDGEGIAELRGFVATSMDLLGGLGPVVPDDSRPSLITATQTIRQIDAAAWEACPTCADGGIAEIPDFATQRLSAVLSGELVPDTASVTPATPDDVEPSTAPDLEADDLPPASVTEPDAEPSTTVGESVDSTVDKVTDTVKKGLKTTTGGGSTSTTGEEETVTGTLVGGVVGILDGLL